jgi:hypothetical protein
MLLHGFCQLLAANGSTPLPCTTAAKKEIFIAHKNIKI